MFLRILLLFLVVFIIDPTPVSARSEWSFMAKVCKVKDGDSFLVEKNGKRYEIRLYGIDAPEYHQPGGRAAWLWLKKNIAYKILNIRVINRDRYNRLVAVVTSGDSNINGELIYHGLARVYDKYCRKQICKRWKQQEQRAKQQRLGLWRQRNPVSPWIWRHSHKKH